MSNLKFSGNKVEKVYSAELNNLAYANKNGVLSGCLVSPSSPVAMTVDVAAGKIFFGTDVIDYAGVTGLAVASNSSGYERIDLVAINYAGIASIIQGTPGLVAPAPDYDPDSYVVVGLLTIPDNITSVASGNIKDIRVENVGGGGGGSSGGALSRHLETFTSQTSVTVTHNLGDDEPFVIVYDNTGEMIIPDTIIVTDVNSLVVTFAVSTSGKIIVLGGAGINNGYYSTTFTSQTSVTVNHKLKSKYVNCTVYNTSNAILIPNSVTAVDEDSCTVTFLTAQSGVIVITGGVSSNRRADEVLIDTYENFKISATNVSSNISFANPLNVYNIKITNAGLKTAFIKFGATAVATDFPILSKTKLVLTNVKGSQIAAICGGTDTTSLYIQAELTSGGSSRDTVTQTYLNCTASTATTTLAAGNKKLIVFNYGDYITYQNYGSTATLNDMALLPYDYTEIENCSLTNIAGICDTGNTSSLRILQFS